MRFIPLAALLLVAAAPAEKKPAATVASLIETTMKRGEALMLEDSMASKLGYAAPMPIRDLQVADTSKDTQLASVVVLKDGKPDSLIISSTTVTEWAGEQPVAIDGYSLRSDLTGRFKSAIRAQGKVGAVVQSKFTGAAAKKFHAALLRSILTQPSVTGK
jgi:hypothetical protein